MRESFITKRFNKTSLMIIDKANEIITDYTAQGYQLTLRQLYYQFVSKNLIENTMKSYKNMGSVINDGRLAGLIDWDSIEDTTRNLSGNNHHTSPKVFVDQCAWSFKIDRWKYQTHRIEVWVEKDALAGVVGKACGELDIDYFSCRGYVSQSEMYNAAKRLQRYQENGQEPLILHFGDHDPSGKDMTRDIFDRQDMFARGAGIDIKRVALNMDQINKYKPPANPAKFSDTRAAGYVKEFGKSSWELDALEPKVIHKLILDEVTPYINQELWDEAEAEELAGQKKIRAAAKRMK